MEEAGCQHAGAQVQPACVVGKNSPSLQKSWRSLKARGADHPLESPPGSPPRSPQAAWQVVTALTAARNTLGLNTSKLLFRSLRACLDWERGKGATQDTKELLQSFQCRPAHLQVDQLQQLPLTVSEAPPGVRIIES